MHLNVSFFLLVIEENITANRRMYSWAVNCEPFVSFISYSNPNNVGTSAGIVNSMCLTIGKQVKRC